MGSMLNSYIIAKDSHRENVECLWPNFQDFLLDNADGLIGDFTASKDALILDTARQA
ncbi:hypothetical protein DPMN_159659 [Dreissena polymorpha]|uniref:Uncharacterized protein n=1 Tax=Dreissena polymorpha TaxID=45954 RepID=A0A9D4EPL6_DREPO|nr:hypothetical protein DPMN_159659 [Dreissena polymorpha]